MSIASHPNRQQGQKAINDPARTPKPAAIKRLRESYGLTQTQAGELVFTTCRVWQQWEAGDRRMHPASWQLFQIKADPINGEAIKTIRNGPRLRSA